MTLSGALARPMLAGIFIYGGIDALRHPETKVKAADEVAPLIVSSLGLPATDTEVLVRANGAVQVVAGTLLGLGKARRLAAVALAASLIPTTYAGHRFWEEVDEERRAQQRIHFLKNAAILGGLVLAAGDTGGRASLPWRATQATKRAFSSGQQTESNLRAGAGEAADHARQLAAGLAGDLASQARQVAQSARDSEITNRAVKVTRKAAGDARSELPELARLSRRTLKSARKAANQALEEAVSGARRSELSKAAFRAARQAARTLEDADLGRKTAAVAAEMGRSTAEAAAGIATLARDRLAQAA